MCKVSVNWGHWIILGCKKLYGSTHLSHLVGHTFNDSSHLVKDMTEDQHGIIHTECVWLGNLLAEVNFNFLAITRQAKEITRSCGLTFFISSVTSKYCSPLPSSNIFHSLFYIYLSLVWMDNDHLLLLKYLYCSWKHWSIKLSALVSVTDRPIFKRLTTVVLLFSS